MIETHVPQLSALITTEKEKAIKAISNPDSSYYDIICLIRNIDLFLVSLKTGSQKDKELAQRHEEFLKYAWQEPINYFLKNIEGDYSSGTFASTKSMVDWAMNVITIFGKIGLSSRIIELAEAGLIQINHSGDRSYEILYTHDIREKEHYDRESFSFVKDMMLKIVNQELLIHKKRYPKIKHALGKIIKNPLNKFISYRATEDIELYYAKSGYFHLLHEQAYEDFGEDDKFGNIEYRHYLNFIQELSGAALMHIDCCLKLLELNPNTDPNNIISYTWAIDKTVLDYSNRFGIPKADVDQIISCLILNKDNIEFYNDGNGMVIPPYIQTGANQITRSVYGSLHGAINFLKRELKRKFEKDYFQAANKRELRFRNDLYYFFPDDRLVKINKEINLKYPKLHTDIDAVIFDTKTKNLALIQLKWQDTFYSSTKERRSRISNLYPKANEWLEKMILWIGTFKETEIIKKIGIDKHTSIINEVFYFIIARNHIHFTGIEPDERAAWASFHQIPYSLSRFEMDLDDPIRELYLKLKLDTPTVRVEREGHSKLMPFDIKLESYTIKSNSSETMV